MYERPETVHSTDRFWSLIRDRLRAVGIAAPETLERNADPMADWLNPNLLLSQTCSLPYRKCLSATLELVGTPDPETAGCPPGYYCSILVANTSDARCKFEEFGHSLLAFNNRLSQSGWAAPLQEAAMHGFSFGDFAETGSHLESAHAVARGSAGIAAIDSFSWKLINRFESWSDKLKVIGQTPPAPALPLVTAQQELAGALFTAVGEAIKGSAVEDLDLLPFKAMVSLPKSEYLARQGHSACIARKPD